MKFKRFLLILVFFGLLSCTGVLHTIEGKRIEINDGLQTTQDIEDFIKPYRDHVNKDLDSVLAYSVDTYSKSDGELETAIGNLMADIIYEQSSPLFNKRTGKNIDFVLLNHGGIRAILSKGNITTRTAYQIMPFENSIVVVDLKGQQVKDLITYLTKAKRAHPISSQLHIKLDKDHNLIEANLNEKPLDFSKNYMVATNDYLYNGGDRMTFFQPADSLYVLDYKIRNAMIDYFKKVDTINPVKDNRFIKIKQ